MDLIYRLLLSTFRRTTYVVRALLCLFGFKNKAMEHRELEIYVKWGVDRVVPVSLREGWAVHDLKAALSEKLRIKTTDLRIIFAGKELYDEVKLQDCDMGEHSIIHAVRSLKPSLEAAPKMECSVNQMLLNLKMINEDSTTLSNVGQTSDHKKVHFYVYCTSPCKKMCPGKLRVRCLACKEGTLTVDRDPTCWDDVLIPRKINGVCQSESCDGTLAEFFFKCVNHITSPDDSAVALYLIRNNFKNIPCIACTGISPIVLVFPCSDGHVICIECFNVYCVSRLNERRFVQDELLGYTLDCAAGCPDSLIKEPHHFKLLGEEQYSRYQRFGAEECLLQAGGMLCPRPGCGSGILPDPECRRVICCQQGGNGCGFVFCRDCREGFHIGPCEIQSSYESSSGMNCAITDERAESSRWDEDSKNTIKITTKPCPKCRTPTERDGGCMHMVCTRSQCGFHWCWVCQEEWTRDCMGSHWFG